MIGRCAGTVLSSGPVGSASTRGAANSGSHRAIGSRRLSAPVSTNAMAAATVTGLVIDAMRNTVSRCIGRLASMSRWPISLTCSTFPRCQTSVTAPESSPDSTAWTIEVRLSSRLIGRSLRSAKRVLLWATSTSFNDPS